MVRELKPACSFCGKRKSEVNVLIKSGVDNTKFICGECVAVAKRQINDDIPDLIG